MTWVDFDDLRRRTDLLLVPFGAVEVYGPHLPMGADGIATTALAERIALEETAVIAPLVPVGFSRNLADFPGTIWVRPASLIAYARDMVESFIGWGARRILFLNGHAGNVSALTALMYDLESEYPVHCAQVDWWRFIQPLVTDLAESPAQPHGHAGEFGTSVMLHLAPHAVRHDRITNDREAPLNPYPDIIRPRPYRSGTEDGALGSPSLGTSEKGREAMDRAVSRALEFIRSDEFTAPAGG